MTSPMQRFPRIAERMARSTNENDVRLDVAEVSCPVMREARVEPVHKTSDKSLHDRATKINRLRRESCRIEASRREPDEAVYLLSQSLATPSRPVSAQGSDT